MFSGLTTLPTKSKFKKSESGSGLLKSKSGFLFSITTKTLVEIICGFGVLVILKIAATVIFIKSRQKKRLQNHGDLERLVLDEDNSVESQERKDFITR